MLRNKARRSESKRRAKSSAGQVESHRIVCV
jgi:hypothetical protein